AERMGFHAMAGFETTDILKTLPGLLNLAKARSMDLGQTADIASNILSGFGLEAGEMGRVSDVRAATFPRSNVDLGMLGDTMKYVAPI
ncbi:phage tail tape measure protein, partial [Brachybacterium paraconglomeratum]|uniref:phage tail tape measure protein n=1 Tax=Brachybacterium paraconglomeratum TaxID=173362 RepID=UPI0022AFE019